MLSLKTNSSFPAEKSIATPFKHKILKPLLPNPAGNLNKTVKEEGHALLRTTMGQTIKVFHMPSPGMNLEKFTNDTGTYTRFRIRMIVKTELFYIIEF